MEIQGKSILILGGSGLVGLAVARRLLADRPRSLIISALTQEEAETAINELSEEGVIPAETQVVAEWGNILLPAPLKDRPRDAVLGDPEARELFLDDLYGELSPAIIERSALGGMLLRHEPELLVDCVNTATAFAYQNVFDSAARLRSAAETGCIDQESVERHLATLYLPQLIRHVQILLEALRRVKTRLYLRVGTSGTGGMGLNIPFTHSEGRPSQMLLAKAGVAGAHTLLLFLLARTPGGPAVKEIKPTAAISWKRIGFGTVKRRGHPIQRFDAERSLSLQEAFSESGERAFFAAAGDLQGVFLDAGENGLFSRGEFEVLTELGLMEYITPEEIAELIENEIRGYPTGRDIIAALDASSAGPTYRAGVLRSAALARMVELEQQHNVDPVAYEMLGPPRLAKLLFEAAILIRLFPRLEDAASLEPEETAERAESLIRQDADLRIRILSIGLPIVLPDGRILRGPEVRVRPDPGESPEDQRFPDNGWVDLRTSNWRRWAKRCGNIVAGLASRPRVDDGSRVDVEYGGLAARYRPGGLVAWIFLNEDQGARAKR